MSTRRGYKVTIFLAQGDPAGLKVVEKSNWTGVGLVMPRVSYADHRDRPELGRAGVYLLIGESESGLLPRIYVGEGDPVRPRLDDHFKKKEFWTHAIVFTSKDSNLNKAHVQMLEARLVERATGAKRCELENGNVPQPPSLSEGDAAEVEGFLDDLLLCLPTLGYDLFEAARRHVPNEHRLMLGARGVKAQGIWTARGFVVFAKSQATLDAVPSCHQYLKDLREELIRKQVLMLNGAHYELTQDYTFGSPSTAAGVMLGRAENGREMWKTKDGKTLKEIQELQGKE